MMEFKKLDVAEAEALKKALNRNAEGLEPLRMDPLTTGWAPGEDEVDSETALVNAIMSIPCHY